METKKQKMVKILYVIGAAFFLAVSFWTVAYCTGDDAGLYMWVYKQYELGSVNYGLKALLDPWLLTISLIYSFGLGDNGVNMAMGCFAVWFFFNVLITLFIAMQDVRKNKWVFWLAVFIMIPWGWTNKCHEVITTFSLLIIYFFANWTRTKKKLYLLAIGVIFIYSFVVLNDRMLLLLFTVAPICVYYIILWIQDKEKRKYLYMVSLAIVALVVGIKIVDEIGRNIFEKGLSIMEPWGGYGGDAYLTWIDIYNLFDKGIPSFFQALLNQYNVPIDGGMIQYNSFYWIIRLAIVIFILCSLISRWKSIIKDGIANVNVLDAVATVGVTILICVNIWNGVAKDYGTDTTNYPLNRYASLAWFLLIIIFIRWVDEKYKPFIIVNSMQRITSGVVLSVVLILLIIGYSKPIYKGREALGTQPCQNEIEFLKEQEGKYRYGLASYWRAYPITAMTNGEYVACIGEIQDEELKCISPEDGYSDGSNMFNFILSYVRSDRSISEERIEEIRGDYINKKIIYSDSDSYTDKHSTFGEAGESIIYFYDYDIRWNPKVVMECVGTDYELVTPIEYYFDFPVGTNRIEMTVANSENFDLQIVDNSDVQNVSIQKVDDNKIYVDLICLQNTKVTFKVARKTEELTTIHKIALKRVNGAVTVYEDGQNIIPKIYLKEGSYVFTFTGENLDKLEVDWKGEGIEKKQLTNGKVRRRYQVEINNPQTIQCEISGASIEIDRVSYENAELFVSEK